MSRYGLVLSIDAFLTTNQSLANDRSELFSGQATAGPGFRLVDRSGEFLTNTVFLKNDLHHGLVSANGFGLIRLRTV